MINNVVYYSTTGNIKRFLEKSKTHAQYMGLTLNIFSIEEAIKTNFKEKFHLFVPTRDFGKVPTIVEDFLSLYKDNVISISGSGNRNWGKNFCKAVDIIQERLAIPDLIRIELTGTSKDVHYFIESLKTINSVQ